jgi:DNA-binding CsgD family transcriptional regulator
MVVGRARERARLEQLLAGAREGRSGALVLRGEGGIGKTALLEQADAAASGFTVLRAIGIESESALAFSGLLQLVRPVIDRLGAVPEQQARALAAAVGLGGERETDLFLAYAGALHLLAAASDDRPLLCLVDDVQWLDSASAEALGFVARRIEAERIAFVFALRSGENGWFDARGIEELVVGGLDPEAASELVAGSGVRVSAGVVGALIEATGANPLALLEVPALLSEGQRGGTEPLDDPLAVGDRVEHAFLARAADLSADGRRALLVAAASAEGDLATIARATEAGALDEAEASGLLRVRGGVVQFRHPLVRSAVYSAATAGARRAAHLALADALGADDDDRGLWHRAQAAVGADEELADALDAAAQRAAGRSLVDESRLLERSARLTRDPQRRAPRLLRAGGAALDSGQTARAAAMLSEGLELADDTLLRADLFGAQLHLARAQGEVGARIETCVEEARRVEPLDPARAASLLYYAWYYASNRLDNRRAREIAAHARSLSDGIDGEAPAASLAAFAWQALIDGEAAASLAAARRGASLELGARHLTHRAMDFAECLTVHEDFDLARRLLERAVEDFRVRGAEVDLIVALSVLSCLELRVGRMARASVAAHEAAEIAATLDVDYWMAWALVALADVEAVLGAESGRDHALRSFQLASRADDHDCEARALDALGRLELGLGRASEAVVALERVEEVLGEIAAPSYVLWAPDLVEGYVRSDRVREARAVLDRFERGRPRGAWAAAAAARCRALLATDDRIDEPFGEAVELARAPAVSPFERARAELLWGQRLRRGGRRLDARAKLRSALHEFERLGAASWAERVREELRASGETARPRDPALVNRLTKRELEISLLAGDGATNREIAARLFLSTKTVELHLSRVYRKLGIRSRTELARALPAPD